MTQNATQDRDREDQLGQVLAEWLEAAEQGRPADQSDYLRRYPAFQAELLQCFADWKRFPRPHREAERFVSSSESQLVENGLLGDFRIVREVGKGGMGIVYEAEQISLHRRVALKVLPFAATMDSRHLQRFHNEARAAASLHHSNIVPVFYVGCERGVHFYAMQFIDGQSLSEIIHQLRGQEKKNTKAAAGQPTTAYHPSPSDAIAIDPTVRRIADSTPLSGEGPRDRAYFRKVAELGVQAAEALDYAHQLGIVHRDIKPGNLMLDDRGNLWITDFGLAQMQSDTRLTMTGDLVGTLRYMSPEQALAKRVVLDHRTDIYSLGATLYELLTLQPAFPGEDREELLRQIAFEEPKRPRQVERAVPAELETIVQKAMEKRPQDRYATAQEMADDLERWLKHEPIRARRPTLVKRAAKWVRRHKPLVMASTAVLFMALLLVSYIAWTRHDRAVQRSASEKVIETALEDSRSWQEQRRLPEALEAARRAEGLLAGADVNEALRQQVHSRLADLELLERLENNRLEYASTDRHGHLDHEAMDKLYGQTFREVGLDVEALPEEEAAMRIRKTTVAVELSAMLDHWAWLRRRRRIRKADDPHGVRMLRVALLADPDAWRTRVREAIGNEDQQALRELAASEKVFHLPPATLYVLGSALLDDNKARDQAETFLRGAQRRYPQDFWLNFSLSHFYYLTLQPNPQLEESIRFSTAAAALRPVNPHTHLNVGVALYAKGRLDEAIAEIREAIRLKKDHALAHHNLGVALLDKGHLEEAIAEFEEAIRLRKGFPEAHYNLGNALLDKGELNYAIAEFREAIRLKKDSVAAHVSLGIALENKGQLDDAIAKYREALQIKNDYAVKDYAIAHSNLGGALKRKGQLDEAIAECREALRLDRDNAEAHCNLGLALAAQGRFGEALRYLRRGDELGSRKTLWRYPSGQWIRNIERDAELDNNLSAIVSGQKQPADTAERLMLAVMCQRYKQWHDGSVRFYREAFADQPQLADDLNTQHRYNAACSAALAGCGQGKDADKLDAKERARLRQQALDWLRADLKAYRQLLEKSADKAGPAIAQRMQHWLKDDDFAGVRGDKALAKLPEAERSQWRNLWQQVEALRRSAGGKH